MFVIVECKLMTSMVIISQASMHVRSETESQYSRDMLIIKNVRYVPLYLKACTAHTFRG